MADLLPEEIAALHGWCPECHGSGMVMRFQPEDCPNLDLHTAIEAQRAPLGSAERAEAALEAGLAAQASPSVGKES